MISMNEILMGRAKLENLSTDIQCNIKHLHKVVNVIRQRYGKPMTVTSGLRLPEHNDATSNAAKRSAHLTGEAIDVRDVDGSLMRWVLQNLSLMQELGIYIEDFRWTRSKTKGYWVHLGTRKPSSGRRIFIPSMAPAETPDVWSGKYDPKFDTKG